MSNLLRSVATCAAAIGLAVALAGCGDSGGSAPAIISEPKLALSDLPAPYNEANLSEGALQFVKCRACHSVNPADGHKIGPNLNGVFDRAPGKADDFKFSPVLAAVSRERWTPEDLDHWLLKPADFLPGSSMFFNGIDDATARRDLIGWLMIEASR